jgi:hypothetical protein
MSEPTLADANRAARDLRASLGAPAWALSVMAWSQGGKISLMVRIDPRYAGQVKIPDYFQGFRVDIRSKTAIRAQLN